MQAADTMFSSIIAEQNASAFETALPLLADGVLGLIVRGQMP